MSIEMTAPDGRTYVARSKQEAQQLNRTAGYRYVKPKRAEAPKPNTDPK